MATHTAPRRTRTLVKLRTPFLAVLFLLAGFCYGFAAHRHKLFPYYLIASASTTPARSPGELPDNRFYGWFATTRPAGPSDPLTADQAQQMAALGTIGYLPGYEPAPSSTGVVVHPPDQAFAGYNLYTSGHAPEAVLIDMQGNVLHTWSLPFRAVWPDVEIPDGEMACRPDFWRRAYLYENGELLAIFEGLGLIKLDKYSNLLWSYAHGAHHDLDVTADGRIYVLTRESAEPEPPPSPRRPHRPGQDYIAVLSPNGEFVQRVSVVDALLGTRHEHLLRWRPKGADVTHTNTVEVLDDRLASQSPAFTAGNVLISMRSLNAIAVVDMEQERVVWSLEGPWGLQHDPTVLDNGNMLLFDNRGRRGFSRVIEFDPFSEDVVWVYGANDDTAFFSAVCGSCQRLPNGNTLIIESAAGRAFEVTPDKRIVWEFLNPNRAGTDDELIAIIPDLVRLPPGFPLNWRD